MNKVRCTVCKEYVDRTTVYLSNGITTICTESCFQLKFQGVAKGVAKNATSTKRRSTPKRIPAKTRELVLARDQYRCRYCLTNQNLHIHHIVYRSSGGSNDVENLITLCLEHHETVHSNKRRWQPVLFQAVKEKPLRSLKTIDQILNDDSKPGEYKGA